MKLGIITFHNVINYGSTFQAYAMQEGLAKEGVYTELIDYYYGKESLLKRIVRNGRYVFSLSRWKRFVSSKLNSFRSRRLSNINSTERNEIFNDFWNKHYRLSKAKYDRNSINRVNELYDGFVCGSDQVWNPKYIGHDMTYFLSFVDDNRKRIAYAPSIAVPYFLPEYVNDIQSNLLCFTNISLREKENIDMIRDLVNKEAKVVVDPTFLITKNEWRSIENKPLNFQNNYEYIFCYFLGANHEYVDYVNRVKKIIGLPTIVVTCSEMKMFDSLEDTTCGPIGPSEFLFLIDNARFVCTDSFHGSVFSIIFHKQFITFKRYKDASMMSENSRIYTLLEDYECKNRIINCIDDINELCGKDIDYENVDRNIEEKVCYSRMFLSNEIERLKSII